MAAFWFLLASIFVGMKLFNENVPTSPVVKVTVNVLAIIGVAVLAIFAVK